MRLSRRTVMQSSAAAAALLALPSCSRRSDKAAPNVAHSSDRASALLDEITEQILSAYPETASSLGVDTGVRAPLKSKLTDRTAEGQAKIASDVRATLGRLKNIDVAALDPDLALNFEVTRTVYEWTAEGFDFPFGDVAPLNYNWYYRNSPYAVAQNVGAFVEIPSFLDGSHTVQSREDAEAYLARMEAYAGQLDGETWRVEADGGTGVILPEFLMEKTLRQLRAARAASVESWGIVDVLAKRAAKIDPAFADQASTIARERILPATDRQIAALEALAPKAVSDAGVWARPEGEAYYNWALRAGTTTDMAPDEVHEMGLEELASLHNRMDPILRSIGYTEGTVGARMTALGDDPRFKFSEGEKGRAEIMEFIAKTLDDIRTRMPEAFATQVPGFLEVVRIPPDVEAGAPGAYGGPGSVDGKTPGRFQINMQSPDRHNRFSLADLTYHEAIPGHVWQGEYTFKLPLIRSLLSFNAYTEGWALYAQQLADELGVYDDFPVGRLGYLQSLAFRACRLVVDTGLHAKRWGREQAIDWFVEANGSSRDEVQSEVDRYCAWPGQACGYKVGHTAINRLRDKVKNALGEKFDFRRFNDAVVLGGAVPMSVLDRVIDRYLAGQATTE